MHATARDTHRIPPVLFTGQAGTDGGDETFISLPGGVGMLFCWCPRPEQPFQIGSPAAEAERRSDETPTWVTLSQGFWLAKHPCSQAEWLALGMENRSGFTGDATRPVDNVSWNDANEWCHKAAVPAGWRIALPTEAQWEYAFRAGSGIGLPLGISDGGGVHGQTANFNANYPYGDGFDWINREETLPSGSFPPNAWGLHDMHGQLWEWCANWKAEYPASSAQKPLRDPTGPTDGRDRVLRGGSWIFNGWCCRAAYRLCVAPIFRNDGIGFRPALVPGASRRAE